MLSCQILFAGLLQLAPQIEPPPSVQPSARSVRLFGTVVKNANVRTDPDLESAVLEAIPRGALVEVYDRRGEWLRVRGGWVHGSLVEWVD